MFVKYRKYHPIRAKKLRSFAELLRAANAGTQERNFPHVNNSTFQILESGWNSIAKRKNIRIKTIGGNHVRENTVRSWRCGFGLCSP